MIPVNAASSTPGFPGSPGGPGSPCIPGSPAGPGGPGLPGREMIDQTICKISLFRPSAQNYREEWLFTHSPIHIFPECPLHAGNQGGCWGHSTEHNKIDHEAFWLENAGVIVAYKKAPPDTCKGHVFKKVCKNRSPENCLLKMLSYYFIFLLRIH